MLAALPLLHMLLPGSGTMVELILVALAAGAGLAVYVLGLHLLRTEELTTLVGVIRGRLQRPARNA